MGNSQVNLITEIIDAVSPLFPQESRRGLLQLAFAGEAGGKVLDRIDFTGSNDTFAPALVRELLLFGEVEPGRPALVVLLESLGTRLGVDQRDRFHNLTSRLKLFLVQSASGKFGQVYPQPVIGGPAPGVLAPRGREQAYNFDLVKQELQFVNRYAEARKGMIGLAIASKSALFLRNFRDRLLYRLRGTRVWDAHSGRLLAQGRHGSPAYGVAFSPSGRVLASCSREGKLTLWNADALEGMLSANATLEGHTGGVNSICWSPDLGLPVLSSGSVDRSVRVWDTERGTCLGVLWGHDHDVLCVAWVPRHRLLASSSSDHTIRLPARLPTSI